MYKVKYKFKINIKNGFFCLFITMFAPYYIIRVNKRRSKTGVLHMAEPKENQPKINYKKLFYIVAILCGIALIWMTAATF